MIANCAPQTIKTDHLGVEILPIPNIDVKNQSASYVLEGKSFIGDYRYTSSGIKATVIRFLKEGKIATFQVGMPNMVRSNTTHGVGFYNVKNGEVLISEYGFDSGIPGYRYYIGKYKISSNEDILMKDNNTIYKMNTTKFVVTRKWRMASE